ncbi:hypothetical protein J2853_002504 [Streptosporangium lutulentum]|uniref:Uncharacterized protein n=1 Tax=Streptosporangium lutulentum TaxID=1461250 RepID=A0ABT9Q969_9ACTN|nr:hypothetical protein [Streptosporangium lutulentum]
MSCLISLRCDTPRCGSHVYYVARSPVHAREQAALDRGWTYTAGRDHCRACTARRTPDAPLVAEHFPTNNATRETGQKHV